MNLNISLISYVDSNYRFASCSAHAFISLIHLVCTCSEYEDINIALYLTYATGCLRHINTDIYTPRFC